MIQERFLAQWETLHAYVYVYSDQSLQVQCACAYCPLTLSPSPERAMSICRDRLSKILNHGRFFVLIPPYRREGEIFNFQREP